MRQQATNACADAVRRVAAMSSVGESEGRPWKFLWKTSTHEFFTHVAKILRSVCVQTIKLVYRKVLGSYITGIRFWEVSFESRSEVSNLEFQASTTV